jgi:hypothetical protein
MAFRIQRSQKSLPGVSSTVRANIDVDTGGQMIARAVQGFGGALFDVGTKLNIIEADQQADEAIMQIDDEHYRYLESLKGLEDTSEESYEKAFNESIARRTALLPKNRLAARKVQSYIRAKSPLWGKHTSGMREAKVKDNERTLGFMMQQKAIRSNELNVDENFARYQLHLWKGIKLDVYSKEEAAKYMEMASSQHESYIKSEQLRIKAQKKEDYDAYVERVEQDWLVKIQTPGLLTETEIINSTLEVDKKQEWLKLIKAQHKDILSGAEVVTDEEVKGSLEGMAYDISTGSVEITDFQKYLNTARYIDKTIDNAAYDELLSLGEREFKSYQGTAMKEREVFALGQLVELPTDDAVTRRMEAARARWTGEVLEAEERRIMSDRQLQFDNLDQYKKALRDWLKANPDANAEEIYKQGRSLLVHYRKSLGELRGKIPYRKTPLKEGEIFPNKLKMPPPPMLGKITTWDKFPEDIRRQIWQAYENGWDPNEIMKAVEAKK